MIATTQLLVAASAFTLLWLISVYLRKQPLSDHISYSSPVFIFDLVHLQGIGPMEIQAFKTFLKAQDRSSLIEFLLFNRPIVLEIENYVDQIGLKWFRNYSLAVARGKLEPDTKPFLPEQPRNFNFSDLSVKDIHSLCEYIVHRHIPFNPAVFSVLGGSKAFFDNYRVYKEFYTGFANTVCVPKTDYRRTQMDFLFKNRVVLKGRTIALKDRLRILSLPQLQKMAGELKLSQSIQTKEQALDILAKVPGAAILLAMIYEIDDLFFINPERIDVRAIDRMIAAFTVYAHLLCDASLRNVNKVA